MLVSVAGAPTAAAFASAPGAGETDPAPAPAAITLAYEAASDHLKTQNGTMGNLRTRAAGLIVLAALVTSFSTGLGLINTDSNKGNVIPVWEVAVLVVVFVLIGLFSMAVVWPSPFIFGPNPTEILRWHNFGLNEDAIRKYVTEKMIEGIGQNERLIRLRAVYFQIAIVLTIFEVAVVVVAVLPK
ncbi:hypothetical protein [Streptomyces sp. AS02]|uniref:hypothetical protein n=1 Tax=Streptomyces sp. AS02 TaxID=2938946 RepID=UPI0020209F6B|nr:hypothetical protein [Streptomyces sp. AS02]MCL8014077.1 hypothetical protein [Streptomyces sp. AS02]